MNVSATLTSVQLSISLPHVKVVAQLPNNKVLAAQNEFANHAMFVLTKMDLSLLVIDEATNGKENTNASIAVVMLLLV